MCTSFSLEQTTPSLQGRWSTSCPQPHTSPSVCVSIWNNFAVLPGYQNAASRCLKVFKYQHSGCSPCHFNAVTRFRPHSHLWGSSYLPYLTKEETKAWKVQLLRSRLGFKPVIFVTRWPTSQAEITFKINQVEQRSVDQLEMILVDGPVVTPWRTRLFAQNSTWVALKCLHIQLFLK